MSVISKLASSQNRRDEAPNQQLATQIATSHDTGAVKELVENLSTPDINIQSDCIKTLYTIGTLEPELIDQYWETFLRLLQSPNNRLNWGTMITLSTIAHLRSKELATHIPEITDAVDKGSVITKDNGIKTLAIMAKDLAGEPQEQIWKYLIRHLSTCRAKDIPQHTESTFVALKKENQDEFRHVLEERLDELTATQQSRVKKLLKKLIA